VAHVSHPDDFDRIAGLWHEPLPRAKPSANGGRGAKRKDKPRSDADASTPPRGLLVVPLYVGRRLGALLYVDVSTTPGRSESGGDQVDKMVQLSKVVARTVAASLARPNAPGTAEPQAWDHYIERTPPEEIERRRLVLLLERHEWNVARVARALGVTRATVYLRLRRHGIPRRRVPKPR
jgi:hypothetical protein